MPRTTYADAFSVRLCTTCGLKIYKRLATVIPDRRKDLESRTPNLGRYTTKGSLSESPLRDLLFGSLRGSAIKPNKQTLERRASTLRSFVGFFTRKLQVGSLGYIGLL